MSRHLFVGDGTAYSSSSGLVAAGALSIEKLSENGPTELVVGDTIADSEQIRIVQGTSGNNLVSPWFYGRNVISFSGKESADQSAATVTIDIAGTSSAKGDLTLKFVRKGGPRPEFFQFSTEIASGRAKEDVAADIVAAYNALTNLPDWLSPASVSVSSTDQVVFSGILRGATAQSGDSWDYEPSNFEMPIDSELVPAGLTVTIAAESGADPGVGEGSAIIALEESLHGVSHGFYDRLKMPNKPAVNAVAGTDYDIYVIAATKDGSTMSAIQGVDNLIEITVALSDATSDANRVAFESKLNGYLASAGLAPVSL